MSSNSLWLSPNTPALTPISVRTQAKTRGAIHRDPLPDRWSRRGLWNHQLQNRCDFRLHFRLHLCDDIKLKEELLKMGEEPGQLNLDTIFTQSQKYEQRMHNVRKPTQDVTISAVTSNVAETFDTIVWMSKRYYCPKVMYRYHISIQILYLKSHQHRYRNFRY